MDSAELDFEALKATPVGKLLSKRDMQKRLRPVSETKVRRTTWLVERDSSEVELILDEGKVTAGGAEVEICEVELELKRGSRSELFAMAQELGGGLSLRMGVCQQVGAGFPGCSRAAFGASRRPKYPYSRYDVDCGGVRRDRPVLPASLSPQRAADRARHECAGPSPGRVAMRRLRSALTLFRPVVSDADFPGCVITPLAHRQIGRGKELDVLLETEPAEGRLPIPRSASSCGARARKLIRRSRLRSQIRGCHS